MGRDVLDTIRYFGDLEKLFKVHFRNVSAPLPHFVETFLDNGYHDMYGVVRALSGTQFDGVMVADNYHGAVQLFTLSGTYLSTLCGRDGKPVLFANPVSLASRGSTLFVLEMGAGRVRAFEVR